MKEWVEQQRAAARAKLPLHDDQMHALFKNVDACLEVEGCDHTLRITRRWLASAAHPTEPVIAWLADNGGYCDCEVVANAEQHWEESRERTPRRNV